MFLGTQSLAGAGSGGSCVHPGTSAPGLSHLELATGCASVNNPPHWVGDIMSGNILKGVNLDWGPESMR